MRIPCPVSAAPRHRLLVAAVLVVAAADAAASASPASASPAAPGRGPRGYRVVPRPAERGPAPAALPGALVYLNRHGGTFRPGYDHSGRDESSILEQPVTLSPFPGTSAAWGEVMDCVQTLYGAYDITFVDEDPGATPHIEAVVAGASSQMGGDLAGTLGVAPLDEGCAPIERAIVFTFAADHGGDLHEMCVTTVHEIGHALGLDHVYYCEDPMSYLEGCEKTFQDLAMPCGEDGVRPCFCGGETQNSAALLFDVLGEAGPADDGGGGDDGGDDDDHGPAGCDDCAGLGHACAEDAECASGECGRRGEESLCTSPCDPTGAMCPTGFDCVPATGGGGVCWPHPESGGCAASAPGPSAPAAIALTLFILFCRRRPRTPESPR